jgi:hypothetical protein
MHGTSMAYTFDDADAADQHETQYFEMFYNRGIYHKDWSAVTKHRTPWDFSHIDLSFDDDVWELYDGTSDWTQAHDLAKEMPEKLQRKRGRPADWVGWLKLILGVLLLLVGLREWRAQPAEGVEVAAPKWMGMIERFTPVKALGVAVVLSGLNPKNLLFIIGGIGGAAAVAQTGISAGEQEVVWLVRICVWDPSF